MPDLGQAAGPALMVEKSGGPPSSQAQGALGLATEDTKHVNTMLIAQLVCPPMEKKYKAAGSWLRAPRTFQEEAPAQ